MNPEQVVETLRQDFAPGGEWAPCSQDDAECGHGECETAHHVIAVLS